MRYINPQFTLLYFTHQSLLLMRERTSELVTSELVMGHFFKTQPKISGPNQPNLQKSPPDPTHPIIDTWYGILGYTENFIQLLHVTDKFYKPTVNESYYSAAVQYSLTDSRVFHDVKNITQSSLHSTQPNPQKIKKLTQPMDGPNP